MDPYDSLALLPGAAGDEERARQLDPPLPFESPAQTEVRQAAVQQQGQRDFATVQRFRAGDFARRGIPAFTDFNTGETTPVTDATGAPVTKYDAKNNVGWDSSGHPVAPGFDEAGQPKLSDPFEGLAPITDQKTGHQYRVRNGLPWQWTGQDPDIAASNLQKEQEHAVAQASSALGRKLTLNERQTHLDETEFRHHNKAFASNFGPIDYDNPDDARATLEKSFDEQYRAPEATKTGWFDSKLTPEAQQVRAGIDATKTKALQNFDGLVQARQTLDQKRAAINQTAAQRDALEQQRVDVALGKARQAGVIPGLDDNPPPTLLAGTPQSLGVEADQTSPKPPTSQTQPSAPAAASSQESSSPTSTVIPGLTEAQKKSDEVDRTQVAAALPPAAQQVAEPAKTNAKGEVQPEGFWATAGRAFGSKMIPAAATAVGGIAGGAIGGLAGLETGPGAIATAIAGDIAGGALAGTAAAKAQRAVMGDQWANENDAQMEANAKAHPVAAQIGAVVPFLVSLFGGGGATTVKLGEQIIGKATTAIGKAAIKDALEAGARYETPLIERLASHAVMGARAGASEGAQEKYVEGRDVSVLDETAKSALQFGATGLFPMAKTMLGQVFGKAVTDAAAMTFAGDLYDAAAHGKPFDIEDTAKKFAGDVPGFVIQNALLGFLSHGMASLKAPGTEIKMTDGVPEGTSQDVGDELRNLKKTDPEKWKQRVAEEIAKRQQGEYPVAPPTAKEWMNAVDVRLAQMRGHEGIDHSEEANGLQKVKDALSKTPGGEEPPAPEAPSAPAPTKPPAPPASPAAKAATPNDDLLAERADLQQKVARTPQSATDAALLAAEKTRLANVERELAATLPTGPAGPSAGPPAAAVAPSSAATTAGPSATTVDGETIPGLTESTGPAAGQLQKPAVEGGSASSQPVTAVPLAQASGQAPVASSEATPTASQIPTSRTSDSDGPATSTPTSHVARPAEPAVVEPAGPAAAAGEPSSASPESSTDPIAAAPAAQVEGKKTRLDLLLDGVERTGKEVTIEVTDANRENLTRIVETAEKRGMDASTDGRHVLIRKRATAATSTSPKNAGAESVIPGLSTAAKPEPLPVEPAQAKRAREASEPLQVTAEDVREARKHLDADLPAATLARLQAAGALRLEKASAPRTGSPFSTDPATGVVTVHLGELAQALKLLEPEGRPAYVERSLDHELRHHITLKSMTRAEIEAVGKSLTDDERHAAEQSYGSSFPSDFEAGAEAIAILGQAATGESAEAFHLFTEKARTDEGFAAAIRKWLAYARDLVRGLTGRMSERLKEAIARVEAALKQPEEEVKVKEPTAKPKAEVKPVKARGPPQEKPAKPTHPFPEDAAALDDLFDSLSASRPSWKPPVRGGTPAQPSAPAILTPAQSDLLKSTYRTLVARTGFPAVMISELAKQTGIPLGKLKAQIEADRLKGNVVLSIGDWSLATEEQRAGVIDVPAIGRALQVRFLPGALGAASPRPREKLDVADAIDKRDAFDEEDPETWPDNLRETSDPKTPVQYVDPEDWATWKWALPKADREWLDGEAAKAAQAGDVDFDTDAGADTSKLSSRGAEAPDSRYRIADLPREMREQLFNDHATFVNPEATERGFYGKSVPSGWLNLPGVQVENIPEAQLRAFDVKTAPPVVIADGKLMDGQHRIAAARKAGVTRIRYVDLSKLLDTSNEGGGSVSTLPSRPESPASDTKESPPGRWVSGQAHMDPSERDEGHARGEQMAARLNALAQTAEGEYATRKAEAINRFLALDEQLRQPVLFAATPANLTSNPFPPEAVPKAIALAHSLVAHGAKEPADVARAIMATKDPRKARRYSQALWIEVAKLSDSKRMNERVDWPQVFRGVEAQKGGSGIPGIERTPKLLAREGKASFTTANDSRTTRPAVAGESASTATRTLGAGGSPAALRSANWRSGEGPDVPGHGPLGDAVHAIFSSAQAKRSGLVFRYKADGEASAAPAWLDTKTGHVVVDRALMAATATAMESVKRGSGKLWAQRLIDSEEPAHAFDLRASSKFPGPFGAVQERTWNATPPAVKRALFDAYSGELDDAAAGAEVHRALYQIATIGDITETAIPWGKGPELLAALKAWHLPPFIRVHLRHMALMDAHAKGEVQFPDALSAASPFRTAANAVAQEVAAAKSALATAPAADAVKSGHDATGTIANMEGGHARHRIRLDYERPKQPGESRRERLTRENLNMKDLQAARLVEESGGDASKLVAKRAELLAKTPVSKEHDSLIKGFLPIYDHAIAHAADLYPKGAGHRVLAEGTYNEAIASGEDYGPKENYVRRVTQAPPDQNEFRHLFQMGTVKGNNPRDPQKHRVFDTIGDALLANHNPGRYGIHESDQNMVENHYRILGQKAFVQRFQNFPAPSDGKPIIGALETITHRNGQTETRVPDGYRVVQINGAPRPVHKEFAPLFSDLYGTSAIRQSVAGRALLKFAAFTKTYTLVGDTFHLGRVGIKKVVNTGFGPSIELGRALTNYADADLGRAVASGEIAQKSADYARSKRALFNEMLANGLNIGKVADNLMEQARAHVPGFGKLNDYIFNDFSRNYMTISAIAMAERNLAAKGRFATRDEAIRQAAKEANEQFGNLQNQGIFTNKTLQDLSRIMLLAPQWTEAMARSEGRAYAQFGKAAYRMGATKGKDAYLGNSARALAIGFAAFLAVNQLINYLTRGHSTFENEEEGHHLDAWIPGGKRGFFFSPWEIVAEYMHAASKYFAQHEHPVDIATHIVRNKLSPLAHGTLEAATDRDATGRHYLNSTDRFRGAVMDALPSPLPLGSVLEKDARQPLGYRITRAPGALEKQALQSVGAKVTPAQSARTQMFAIAQPYRPDGGKTDAAGVYTELRRALDNADHDSARTEIEWLQQRQGKSLETIGHALGIRKEGGIAPERFTGGEDREREMLARLTGPQRAIYAAAQKDHAAIARQFQAIIRTLPREVPKPKVKTGRLPAFQGF